MRSLFSSLLLIFATASAYATDPQYEAVALQVGDKDVVVRIQRDARSPACAVGVDFGDGRSQTIRLEDEAPVEVRHRYNTAGPFVVEVAGRTSFRGIRTVAGCLGNPMKVGIGKNEGRAGRALEPRMSATVTPSRVPVPGGRRVALVIGNDAYQHHDLLPNSVNDVRLVGDVLKRLGFEVNTVNNATRIEMMTAIEKFETRATGADAVIFYFSGHGLQDRSRRNYLMPIDARLQGESSISGYGVDTELIIGVLERVRARVNLILLDACRDWPQGRVQRMSAEKSVLMKAMSAVVPPSLPDSEVLVQFATRAGEKADAGSGTYSPYAVALAASLVNASSQPIRLMLDNVMDETVRLTGGTQRPEQFGDMRSTTLLVDPAAGTPQMNLPVVVAPDEQHWRRIERTSTRGELTEFAERYPRSQYVDIAKARLNQMDERERSDAMRRDQQAWLEADRRGTREAYDEYMRNNRNGAFHQQAQARLEAIAERGRSEQAARDEQDRLRRLLAELEEERRRLRVSPAIVHSAGICDVSGNPRTPADWQFNACVAPTGLPTGVSCTCRSPATGAV